MSRSIKKNMGGTWVVCKNVKSDRKVYHSNERAKVREQLKSILDDPENEELDNKIIKNRIDRDVYFGDPYSWGSDGGSYLISTISDLKNDLSKILSQDDLFETYKRTKAKEYKRHWRFLYNSTLEQNLLTIAPNDLKDEDELYDWINNNQEKIFDYYKKMNYGK